MNAESLIEISLILSMEEGKLLISCKLDYLLPPPFYTGIKHSPLNLKLSQKESVSRDGNGNNKKKILTLKTFGEYDI